MEQVASLGELRDEWEQLDLATNPRLPFTSALWNGVWWKHLREHRLLARDSLRLFAVRDEARTLRAIAPMMLTERPSLGPLRVRILQPFGADPNVTEIRGVICAPADEGVVYEALLDHLNARGGEWDWLMLGGIRRNALAAEVVGRQPGVEWLVEIPDFLLSMPAEWETFRVSRGRNIKESLRKCYNSLKRDGLDFQMRVLTTPAQMEIAFQHFVRLHAARAALSDTVMHRNVFDSRHAREFLRDYLAGSAERGEARIFQLEISGQIVATRLGFLLGDTLYLYFSGFDPAFGKYSVMTTTVGEALKWAIAEGVKTVNLSPGNDVSKTRWDPVEVVLCEAIVPSPRLRGRLLRKAYVRLERASRHENSLLGRALKLALRRT